MAAIDSNQEFIGCCSIHNILIKEPMELGLWLKKDAQGNGYGTEIIAGLIESSENNFTFKYIFYPVDEENKARRRIPEKLGFTPFKRYQKKKNSPTDLSIVEYRKYYSSF